MKALRQSWARARSSRSLPVVLTALALSCSRGETRDPPPQEQQPPVAATASEGAALLREAEQAGTPRRPPGWQAREGERVVVRIGSGYVSGTVREARADLVLLTVDGEEQTPRAVLPSDVFAQPPVPGEIAPGYFACLRPPQGERVWRLVRVVQVSGERVQARDADGVMHDVAVSDVLPLQRGAGG